MFVPDDLEPAEDVFDTNEEHTVAAVIRVVDGACGRDAGSCQRQWRPSETSAQSALRGVVDALHDDRRGGGGDELEGAHVVEECGEGLRGSSGGARTVRPVVGRH